MTSNNGNSDGKKRTRSFLEEIQQLRANADKGREPELIASRMGTRMYSMAALLERILAAFIAEHSGGTEAFYEADTESRRLKLLLGTVDYVLAVESIQIADDDKAELIRRAYTELFTYGPLDDLFADENITTISLEGQNKVSVRYGHGELVRLDPIFEDEAHLRKIISRLLLDSGAELRPDVPLIEAGLPVNGRPVSVNIVAPPVTIALSVDIRVHPLQPPSLADMVDSDFMTAQAADFLQALVWSPHGFVIVGDTESGKTTLLTVLAMEMLVRESEEMISVERAGELRLPEGAEQLVVQWPNKEQDAITFGEQISIALEKVPACILLDEVRSDEPESIAPLLSNEDVPRQIWSFRGPSDSKRLASALGMLARRSDMSQSEAMVQALYHRLPFVITVRRRQNTIQLYGISEWQFPEKAKYPQLCRVDGNGTGKVWN